MSELPGKQEVLVGGPKAPMKPDHAPLLGKAFPVQSIPFPILPRLESTLLVLQLLFDDYDDVHQVKAFPIDKKGQGVLPSEVNLNRSRDKIYRYYSKDVQKLITQWSEMDRRCSYYKANLNKLIQEVKAKAQEKSAGLLSDDNDSTTTGATDMKVFISVEERQKLAAADAWYRGCLAFQSCPQRMISLRRCWFNFMEANRNDNTAITTANILEACKHKTDDVEACAGAKVEHLLLNLLSEQQQA